MLSSVCLGDESGGRLGPCLKLGAEASHAETSAGWRIDRPSASARITGSDPSPRTSRASRDAGREGSDPAPSSLGAESRQGARVRQSRASDTPLRLVERSIQAPGGRRRRPSRAFFVPRSIRSEANGREPGRPAPPPLPSSGQTAAGLPALADGRHRVRLVQPVLI